MGAPVEGLATFHPLDVVGVHAAVVQHLELGVTEVVADRAHHTHVGEEARGQAEVDGGTAQHPIALPEWGANGIERDAANDGQ